MFKYLALILVCLSASASNSFVPLKTSCTESKRYIIAVTIMPPKEIHDTYVAKGGHVLPGHVVRAFQGWDADGNAILVLPPLRGQDDIKTLETWGHELAHVVCGKWHP